ncbi:hypothetical protein STENM223S_00838 [Streptomyces tendae]
MSRFVFIKAVLGPIMRLMFRTRVEGVENIPGEGPVILAGNHLTFIDSMILPLVCDRQVVFIGKDEYVTGKGLKGRLMAWFFTGVGMIPVDRDGGRGGVAALMTGRRVLDEGRIFGIYPEGTRSPDGRLYRGRTGIARLTLMTGAAGGRGRSPWSAPTGCSRAVRGPLSGARRRAAGRRSAVGEVVGVLGRSRARPGDRTASRPYRPR